VLSIAVARRFPSSFERCERCALLEHGLCFARCRPQRSCPMRHDEPHHPSQKDDANFRVTPPSLDIFGYTQGPAHLPQPRLTI
jgi:hypothetical protein